MRCLWLAAILVSSLNAWAQSEEITVFDMRKTLALSDNEPTYRDYYLSKGFNVGLKPGMIVTVKRKMPLYDSIHNRSAGDLSVAVARVKIIHCERNLAVARLYADFSRESLPALEDNFIMIGDQVDLATATTESKVKASKAAEAKDIPEKSEKLPETAQTAEFSVDFASQSPDNVTTVRPVDGPVVQ